MTEQPEPIETLQLSPDTLERLRKADVRTIQDLMALSYSDLIDDLGVSIEGLNEIIERIRGRDR